MMAVLLDDQPLDSQHYRQLITWVCCLFLSKLLPVSQDSSWLSHDSFLRWGEGQGVLRLNRKYRTIYRSVVNSYEGALATRLSSLTLSAQNQINLMPYLVVYNMTLGTSPSPRSCQKDKVCYFLCVPTLLFHIKLKCRYEFGDKSWSTSLCQSLQIPHED